MIERIEISCEDYEASLAIRKYIIRKLGRLDRQLPKAIRKVIGAHVILRQVDRAHGNKYEAEVRLTVPGVTLYSADSTVNMYAAVDIVEMKLVHQLRRYREAQVPHTKRRSVLGRFWRNRTA